VKVEKDLVRIGALVTHSRIETDAEIRKHLPLLAEAATHVAHPAIRNRGTLGGSLALADPAAEYPACAVALNAVLVVKNKTAERRVAADKFFKGLFETDLKPGEILAAVEFPKQTGKHAFLELTRRHGDYATVGLAAVPGRFVFFGVGPAPVSFSSVEDMKKNLKPSADLYNTSATKLHLAGVLMERAWNTLSTSR
jgi:carbon-monoxide dehydrogenase medium subunit